MVTGAPAGRGLQEEEHQKVYALVTLTHQGARWLLMVEGVDAGGWSVPGGSTGPGETCSQAALRKVGEETRLQASVLAGGSVTELPARHVPEPGARDVIIPVHIDLGPRDWLPPVRRAGDAALAEWVPASTFEQLRGALASDEVDICPSDASMLSGFLAKVTP
jgi:ADP-ribose pyrophosphatase YjhB (NUDIX family)